MEDWFRALCCDVVMEWHGHHEMEEGGEAESGPRLQTCDLSQASTTDNPSKSAAVSTCTTHNAQRSVRACGSAELDQGQ